MYVLILAFGFGIVTVNFSISVLPAVPFCCEIDSSPVTIGGVSVIAFVDSVLTYVSRGRGMDGASFSVALGVFLHSTAQVSDEIRSLCRTQ